MFAGAPSEIYYFGIIYSLIGVGWVIVTVIAAHVFIPFFRHTSHISCYEVRTDVTHIAHQLLRGAY